MNEQGKNPFDPFFEEIRRIVREEIEALKPDSNGHDSLTLLDLKQTAKHFNLPKSRISKAVKNGDLPCIKLGHYVRFRPSDLEDFICRHRKKKA